MSASWSCSYPAWTESQRLWHRDATSPPTLASETVSAEHTIPALSHRVQLDETAEVGRRWFAGGEGEEAGEGHIGNRSRAEELHIVLEVGFVVAESAVGLDMVRVAGLGTAQVAVRDTVMAEGPGLAGYVSQGGAAAIQPVPAAQTDVAAEAAVAVAGIALVVDIAADTVPAVGTAAAGTVRTVPVRVVRIAPVVAVVGIELASGRGEWGTLERRPELVQARPGNPRKDCSSGNRSTRMCKVGSKTPPENTLTERQAHSKKLLQRQSCAMRDSIAPNVTPSMGLTNNASLVH